MPNQIESPRVTLEIAASRRSFLQSCLTALAATTLRPALSRGDVTNGSRLTKPLPRNGPDFTFLHFSDSHIDPRIAGSSFNPQGRSIEALSWVAERTATAIEQTEFNLKAEPPHFAIHTGDVFEYSVIDHTWSDWQDAASKFRCPIAPVPGNHDNTWGEINRELRQYFGDDSYSFEYGGCHFVCLNSAGLLDPLPAWDRRTLTWLKEDLAHVDAQTPVFLAMHHPLSGEAGYASPFDKLRIWEVIQNHNVVLMMDGHWHTVHRQQWQGIDRVNGGATFGTHTGYNSVTLRDGVLRVVFHYWQENPARPKDRNQVPLVEKTISRRHAKRNFTARPVTLATITNGKHLTPQVVLERGANVSAKAWIDGAVDAAAELTLRRRRLTARLTTSELVPGWHYVTLRVQPRDSAPLDFGESFWVEPPAEAPYITHRFQNRAAIKTQPVVDGERVVVGDTAGMVTALSLDLEPLWTYSTNSQIVHSVASVDDLVLVGDVNGQVHALRQSTGERIWQRQLPHAIYAAIAMVGDKAVVADAGGMMHALHVRNGQIAWSRKVAAFGFEARPLVHDDLVIGGAWDGRLYALRSDSGDETWSAWCPSWHAGVKGRYYAPADVTPVVVVDHLLVVDRGWRLGRYSLDGKYEGLLRADVSAVAASADARSFYTRGLDNQLVKYSSDGQLVWKHAAHLGRAPTAPAIFGDRVAAVSDTGHLCIVDATSGDELVALSVSPSLFVLSGLGSDGMSRLYAADMDGRLTGIHFTA